MSGAQDGRLARDLASLRAGGVIELPGAADRTRPALAVLLASLGILALLGIAGPGFIPEDTMPAGVRGVLGAAGPVLGIILVLACGCIVAATTPLHRYAIDRRGVRASARGTEDDVEPLRLEWAETEWIRIVRLPRPWWLGGGLRAVATIAPQRHDRLVAFDARESAPPWTTGMRRLDERHGVRSIALPRSGLGDAEPYLAALLESARAEFAATAGRR